MSPPRPIEVWSLALAVLAACSGEPDALPVGVGEVCPSREPAMCASEQELLVCEEREWTLLDCGQWCTSFGDGFENNGCVEDEDGDACDCEAPPDGCFPDELACASDDEIEYCEDGVWTSASCADLCAAEDPVMSSLGCAAYLDSVACRCTVEGTPCDDEPAQCESDALLLECEGGVWTLLDCAAECGVAGHCTATEDTAACACG